MNALDNYLFPLIEKKVFPGISVLAGREENILFSKQFGNLSYDSPAQPVDQHTLYDLASLTKPLITALLTLYLSEKENIPLQTPVGHFFPEISFPITLEQLLLHTSGLPGWSPFYFYGRDYLSQFPRLRLRARPGRRVLYSCVGYILLYYIIGKVAGTPFKQCAEEIIFEPLHLKHTFLEVPEEQKRRAAPTEKGEVYELQRALKDYPRQAESFPWRHYLIQGETHDSNSYYLGGTAGNTGLFSTAADIFRLSREFYPHLTTLLRPETARNFWNNRTPFKRSHRTLGFKRNSSWITSGGRAFSPGAIGHNGFTGSCFWLEPGEEGHTVILLTNRVHPAVEIPGRGNINMNKIYKKLNRRLLRLI